jgi:hypothetical protein
MLARVQSRVQSRVQIPMIHIGALKFSPDGTQLLSTCGYSGCDYTQRVWEVATGKQAVAYRGHDNIVLAAALSLDGQLVATGGDSYQKIHLWKANTGQLEKSLAGKGAPAWAAAFSADGRHLAWGNTGREQPFKGANPREWQVRLAQVGGVLGLPERVDNAAATFLRARTTQGAATLTHRKGGDYGRDEAILGTARWWPRAARPMASGTSPTP